MASTIFNITRPTTTPKLHVSHSSIPPNYLDPSQPPQKRIPFRQIVANPYVRTLSVCMPQHTFSQFFQDIGLSLESSSTYHKVILSLDNILAEHGLRTGNHMMIARDTGNDVCLQLNSGTLTLDMSFAIHQRSGLPFQHTTTTSGGRKHEKSSQMYRYVIDLRSPSMMRGKKAFDRLVYAAKNVKGLSEPKVWLCAELDQNSKKRKRDEDAGSLKEFLLKHHPTTVVESGRGIIQKDVLVPEFLYQSSHLQNDFRSATRSRSSTKAALPTIMEDDMYDIAEYLSMLIGQSSRITEKEYLRTDTSICTYQIPKSTISAAIEDSDDTAMEMNCEQIRSEQIAHFNFSGLVPSDFVMHTVMDLIRRSRLRIDGIGSIKTSTADHWAVISVKTHNLQSTAGVDGYSILLQSHHISETLADEPNSPNQQSSGPENKETATDTSQEKSILPQHSFAIATCFEYVDALR